MPYFMQHQRAILDNGTLYLVRKEEGSPSAKRGRAAP